MHFNVKSAVLGWRDSLSLRTQINMLLTVMTDLWLMSHTSHFVMPPCSKTTTATATNCFMAIIQVNLLPASP